MQDSRTEAKPKDTPNRFRIGEADMDLVEKIAKRLRAQHASDFGDNTDEPSSTYETWSAAVLSCIEEEGMVVVPREHNDTCGFALYGPPAVCTCSLSPSSNKEK